MKHRVLPAVLLLALAPGCSKSETKAPAETATASREQKPADAAAAAPPGTKQAAPPADEADDEPDEADEVATAVEPDFQEQAVFDDSADGKAAAKKWKPRTWFTKPDGSKIELHAVDDVEEGTISLLDNTDKVIVQHEVGGPASEVQGRIAVLDDGRVLFDAGFLTGPRAVSTIYWLRWDAATSSFTVEKTAAFTEEM